MKEKKVYPGGHVHIVLGRGPQRKTLPAAPREHLPFHGQERLGQGSGI